MKQNDIANIDLNLLKIFEALYEEGGASRAAIRLNLTQSAVSAALRRLRSLYADVLFIRAGHGLKPTSRAHELKPIVSGALDKCRESFTLSLPKVDNQFAGRTVAVGLSDDFEIAIGHQLMGLLRQEAPGLRIIFRQTHSVIVSDALANYEMDIAITAGGFTSRGVTHKTVATGEYACLVSPDSIAKNVKALSVESYVTRDHILVSSGGLVGIVDEKLTDLRIKRRISASTTHFAGLPFLLANTDAVATIPLHAARSIAALTGLVLLPCPIALPQYAIDIGWRGNALRDSAVLKVQELLIRCFDNFNTH